MSARQNPWNEDKPFDYDGMWLGTTTCQKNINRKISGNEDVGWMPYALNRYLGEQRERLRCLVLGSGEGRVLEYLCKAGFSGEIIATDIADKALARAQERLRGCNNIRYIVADLNTDTFDGQFDLIVAEGVLHHIENLRVCLKCLDHVLAPAGLLIGVEFEGPFRFQLPDEQLRWINAALNVLPKGLRGGFAEDLEAALPANTQDMARVFYPRASEESIQAFDPSEAISGHIMREALAETFRVIERKPFGGPLLSYMTAHFPFGEANKNPVVDSWLRVLVQIEDTLTSTGVLPDEFVFYVLGRK